MCKLVALHEPVQQARNAMFTHHGRQYTEWRVIQGIEDLFCRVEEYINSILRCLNDNTLEEYMRDRIFAFCP